MLFAVAGCAKSPEPEAETFVLKYSHLENEEHPQGVITMTFKKKIEELSGGQIKVEPYFLGTLYTQDGSLPALIAGDLEMTHTSTALTAQYLPKMAMFTSTYLFKDYDHMRRAMDSEIGDKLAQEIFDSAGYVVLAYYYGGARTLNLRSDKPVTKPEDLKGVILRMPAAEAWRYVGESLGASVTPMAYGEVYMALQSGTIDAQDNPLAGTYNAKFYEVTKQICLTRHMLEVGIVGLSKNVWERMNDQQKAWMKQAAEEAVKAGDAAFLKSDQDLVDFFRSEGMVIVQPDIDAFRTYAANYYKEKGLTANWDMDLYNKIQAMAK
jgi:tripartite ATP-independent transporter DctP family solute receptor